MTLTDPPSSSPGTSTAPRSFTCVSPHPSRSSIIGVYRTSVCPRRPRRRFGWSRDRVVIIDDDLGQSGQSAEGRLGFQRLLAEVALDHVGLILGLEMSRLARSCKDWHQLLEFVPASARCWPTPMACMIRPIITTDSCWDLKAP